VALVTQQRTVSDIAFPSKTVTLLAAGCPVVAAVSGSSEVARVIEASGGGVVVRPEDAGILAQTIEQISGDAGRLGEMKSRAREYAVEQWSAERVLPVMEAALMRAARTREESGSTRRLRRLELFGKAGPTAADLATERLADADD
jgi:colanic acid biosynthesis glycosyl transferase WcaI